MPGKPVFVQLVWEDPVEGPRSATLQTPITLGRDIEQMPKQVSGLATSYLELDHKQVSRYHALITATNQRLTVTDKSANGTFLNGRPIAREGQAITARDTLRVGPFKITASLVRDGATNATELNPDRSQVAGGGSGPNALVIALVGALILLLMGIGTWAIARGLLERTRPAPSEGNAAEALWAISSEAD
ncbi:MAG: FHA domain-containing protein [Cyanobacteria bacterium P01_A01_bin.135]